MLIGYRRGQGSIVLRVKILDSTSTEGAGLTGLAHNSSGLRIGTIADNESSSTAYTSAGSSIETIATIGTYAAPSAGKCRFAEVDATNHPGIYEIQLADARFAVSAAKGLLVSIGGATNAAECDVSIPLRDLDPYAAGSGPYLVTITVNDGTSAIEGATVRLTAGTNVMHADTNASGMVTFSALAATYTVMIGKAGYQFTPTTLAVSATTTQTYSMTEIVITPSADPEKSVGMLTSYNNATEVDDTARIWLQQLTAPAGSENMTFDSHPIKADVNQGVSELVMWRNATYKIWRGTDESSAVEFTPTTETVDLDSIIGAD